MKWKNVFFLESEGGRPAPEKSLFHVLPVPYEKTVSYGRGTARGPEAILAASQQLEAYDGVSTPLEHGIYTHDAVDCSARAPIVLAEIERVTHSILSSGKIPVTLGGEHTVSYGPACAMKKHFGRIGVIHFDAHADLRDEFEGYDFSHACVMRRIHEQGAEIVQYATRSYCIEEQDYRILHNINHYDAAFMHRKNIRAIELPDNFPDDIYISVDVDGLDPSVIPHTGTPVPGGIMWHDFFTLLDSIPENKRIRGFDVVELSPSGDSRVSDFATAQLVYNIMGIISRRMEPAHEL